MNRDEQRSRARALPPSRQMIEVCAVLFPREKTGGTWIGLNAHGITLALVNWYSVTRRAEGKPLSRGEVVLAALAASTQGEVAGVLQKLDRDRLNPFRLIGVFPATREIVEWRWNLERLIPLEHPWQARQWISSGLDEARANEIRGATFRTAQRQASSGTTAWLDRLHRSHRPESGPFATCMHRSDAVTVSCTRIVVGRREGAMSYHGGPPCEGRLPTLRRLAVDWSRGTDGCLETRQPGPV